MTFIAAQLLSAIEQKNTSALWAMFQNMTVAEMVAAGTALGPERLRGLHKRFAGWPEPRAANIARVPDPSAEEEGDDAPVAVLAEILAQAFNDTRFKSLRQNAEIALQVKKSLVEIHARRRGAVQLAVNRDVTGTLPQQTICPAPLSDLNYKEVADRHGTTVASIKAVAKVESGGRSGFDDAYRPKILFEAHHFGKLTNHLFDYTHPHLSARTGSAAKHYYGWDQYGRLFEAMILDPIPAVKAASWGKFQVLGSNHNGWREPVSFARAMFESEANHLKSFEAYCVSRNIMRHLKTNNWAAFAEGYNGAGYKTFSYDTKMAAAYKSYGGK